MALDMVHNRPIGEVAVKGEVARNTLGNHPINQVLRQSGMVLERMSVIALLTLAKTPEVERIVLATRVDVVDEQIVVGDQVTLVGVVPKPANIVDQFAVMVNQGVVNRDDAVLTIAGGWVMLEPFETLVIQTLRLPRRLGQEAVEAGLVGRISELASNTTDCFMFGDKQTSDVFGKVNACWLIRE